ncbi:MAG: alkaline phosphatase family protein, partial [Solirubrobacteraceae bacterium]
MGPRRIVLLLLIATASMVVAQTATARSSHHKASRTRRHERSGQVTGPSSTPIKHVVVIYQENVSFDHYFATYPNATNPAGEPLFHASRRTPSVNGLTGALLSANPNEANPLRLDRSHALTCDQDHGYTHEQQAFDSGLMDKFVQFTQNTSCVPPEFSSPGLVMDYYDGNTVTALWNYAQHFAM